MSMTTLHCLTAIAIGATLSALSAAEAASGTPDPAAIRRHAEFLTAIPDRSPGSEGARVAADYIARVLAEKGFAQVLRQHTTLAMGVDRGSRLIVEGKDLPLVPMPANGAALPSTGGMPLVPADQEARLVLVGEVTDKSALAALALDGGIALIDGRTSDVWMTCAGLGARAAVFYNLRAMDGPRLAAAYLDASLAFPRFGLDFSPEQAAALAGKPANLVADLVFDARVAETLVAKIEGSLPATAREAVVLTAGYESGPCPFLDPGATRAWNAGLLLELAGLLKTAPPPRNDVIVVFNGARGEQFRGLRQFVAALTDPVDRPAVEDATLGIGKSMGRTHGEVEIIRTYKDLWRAQVAEAALREFMRWYDEGGKDASPSVQGQGDDNAVEAVLNRLLAGGVEKRLPYLPEETVQETCREGVPSFLGLPLCEDERTRLRAIWTGAAKSEVKAAPAVVSTVVVERSLGETLRAAIPIGIAVILLLVALSLLILQCKHRRIGWGRLVCAVAVLGVVDYFLLRKEEKTGAVTTDVAEELGKTGELGRKFLAEKAGELMMASYEPMQIVRLVDSLERKTKPTERDRRVITQERWRYQRMEGRPLPAGVALRELAEEMKVRYETLRNMQQRVRYKKPLDLEGRRSMPDLVRAIVVGEGGGAGAARASSRGARPPAPGPAVQPCGHARDRGGQAGPAPGPRSERWWKDLLHHWARHGGIR